MENIRIIQSNRQTFKDNPLIFVLGTVTTVYTTTIHT